MVDYNVYRLKVRDFLFIIPAAVIADYMLLYLFYQSRTLCIVMFIPLILLVIFYLKRWKIAKRKRLLEREFEEMLGCISAALRTGYSLENSFSEAEKEMILMYGNDSDIARELGIITRGLRLNMTIVELMRDMAKRCGINDIISFCEILIIAKKSGGNIIEIAKHTADNIRDKRELEEEINAIIAGKRFEYAIMCIMPFIMLIYLRLCSPGYLSVMYGNLAGIFVMSTCLVIYILSVAAASKIMNFSDVYYGTKLPIRLNGRLIISERVYRKIISLQVMNKVKDKLLLLYSGEKPETVYKSFISELTKRSICGTVCAVFMIIVGVCFDVSKLPYFLIISMVLIILFPYSMLYGLDKSIKSRNSQLIFDYPDFINQFALLVGAGSSMTAAIEKCVGYYTERKRKKEGGYHFLYEELDYLVKEIKRGVNEAVAYERLGKRIRLLPYMKLTTMLVQNLKKGNKYIINQLNMTVIEAYEKKRDNIRKQGEEAGAKLLLPMMLEFLLVLIIIMYPALMAV